ncbi:MAG: signal recognition particle-docking protein FtsY [Eggerthellaceae bacterium]|nr:signal recognition particle-docking protein FtsY [Eggerthellaceae bacterium]
MAFFERISKGLSRSRNKFKEQMNVLLDRGPKLDEDFWELLEETLILSDVGAYAADSIVENLRDQAARQALPDAYAVLDLLNDQIATTFTEAEDDIFNEEEAVVLFVGINGTGKTTTVGKIAKEYSDAGRAVILGSADTFRAAAIEQLEVWAERAGVEMVTRERGSDPASVCYDTIERAEQTGANLVLIDTAGRLHTSADLMRELEKVVNVVRKRSQMPVYTILVIDATTGQNGLQQAREFNKALDLDGLIVTKLDGTAKGGIALAVSHELELPIYKIGVGEGIEDLRDFDAHDFASALIGDFDERYDDEDTNEKEFDDEAAEHEVAIEEDEIVSEDLPEETSVEEVYEEEIQEAPQEESQDELQDESQEELQDELQDESQEESQEESQDEPQEEQPKKKKHFWERWF